MYIGSYLAQHGSVYVYRIKKYIFQFLRLFINMTLLNCFKGVNYNYETINEDIKTEFFTFLQVRRGCCGYLSRRTSTRCRSYVRAEFTNIPMSDRVPDGLFAVPGFNRSPKKTDFSLSGSKLWRHSGSKAATSGWTSARSKSHGLGTSTRTKLGVRPKSAASSGRCHLNRTPNFGLRISDRKLTGM